MAGKAISNDKEILPQKEQISSLLLPSYVKSYSETSLESTTVDYTWRINKFKCLINAIDMLKSPAFPENGRYMNLYMKSTSLTQYDLKVYLLTTKPFVGLCTTSIKYSDERSSSQSISGYISNMTELYEGLNLTLKRDIDSFIIRCKLKIFRHLKNDTKHICNLLPSSTISKDIKSLEDSTFEDKSKGDKSITFLLGTEKYIISKKLLWTTNSNYFKNICLTHEAKEKDMTNELKTNEEIEAFKQILLFIITGSQSVESYNYYRRTTLFKIANKYDVVTLKLICEHYLLESITVNNAIELIQLAFTFKTQLLETYLINFIKFYIKEIVNTEEFQNLPEEDSNKIIKLIKNNKKSEVCDIMTDFKPLVNK
ncbi:TD and POZ domain-containing protein 1-like [Monomorium pharaonis]|uniref:TD and POZ domain-containing protein 1-like n=1 Tax=Monomorium pharaonis TaxID=307658 RepID=UPI00174670A2|nr:TD and POZ domain-containing protein 1-like [Monomorium pharaonis]XP_028048340.2 TD and POZ domain-containing protein 1-like [Monomorium pharaonis]